MKKIYYTVKLRVDSFGFHDELGDEKEVTAYEIINGEPKEIYFEIIPFEDSSDGAIADSLKIDFNTTQLILL